MIERGVFDGIDAAMMVHPSSRTKVAAKFLATTKIEVEFVGRSAHASAAPDQGINALDALVASYVNISLLRQQTRRDARIHGIITKGGDAANVIPALATGTFGVRAADDTYLSELLEKVIGCFKAGAQATGASFSYRITAGYSAFRSNIAMEKAFGENLVALNIGMTPDDGQERMASTDMGNVSQVVPSIHAFLAIADGVGSHTPEFAAAAVSDRGHLGLVNAAKALAATAIDLMTAPELLARAKEEFARR